MNTNPEIYTTKDTVIINNKKKGTLLNNSNPTQSRKIRKKIKLIGSN